MSGLYPRLQATALRMLAKYGTDWTITKTTGASASSSRTAKAVAVDTVRHLLGDSGVEIGDLILILESGADPVKGERITDGTRSLVIMQAEAIRPASTTIAWSVWARAG